MIFWRKERIGSADTELFVEATIINVSFLKRRKKSSLFKLSLGFYVGKEPWNFKILSP
ncbi:hypothetical protein LEP1GSC062_2914 [Leptospira alexanderi serovar Manhao 3 str. L 60]|uniref:Uncharacterized protein n=1 Tax=Leptospira alexanderi serovar Manhao 3 str. L 60 TaxID=1049759 RepID=V6HX83_9LEPT|nr:hypothetical protein LEP1GSC062_2914 [Leptospira alexanderi serovar Manhao 3 str. L 60]